MVDATKICGGGSADEEYGDPDRMRREYYGVSEEIADNPERIEYLDAPGGTRSGDVLGDGAHGDVVSDSGAFDGETSDDDTLGEGACDDEDDFDREIGADAFDREAEEDVPDEPHHGPRSAPRRPKPSHVEIGMRGEEAAARFLRRRGYDIVARNWKCPAGEADIIAHDGDTVVFVEVKTRTSFDRGMPEEAVGPKKRQRYERIAAYFLADYQRVDVPVRFDVVALLIVAPDRALVRHHINAFGAA